MSDLKLIKQDRLSLIADVYDAIEADAMRPERRVAEKCIVPCEDIDKVPVNGVEMLFLDSIGKNKENIEAELFPTLKAEGDLNARSNTLEESNGHLMDSLKLELDDIRLKITDIRSELRSLEVCAPLPLPPYTYSYTMQRDNTSSKRSESPEMYR